MVLLIEDNPNHAELVVEALRHHFPHLQVEVATTGGEGLARVWQGGYDLVILDYQLPDGDGLFWLERIREREPDLPVVMATGRGSEGVAVEAFRKGAWDYIVKSVDYVELLPQVVEGSLKKARLLRERQQQMAKLVLDEKNRLEAILGAITDAIVVLDRDFTLQEINQKLAFRFCYQQFCQREEVCPDCPAQKVFETGMPASAIIPRFRADGSVIELHISAYPLKDERGEVVQVVAYVRDVTEERQATRQLEQSRRLSALGEMVANIAHEIKNPLQNTRLGMDPLKRGGGKEGSLVALLQGIERGMKAIDDIVEKLLDYARLLQLYRVPWDLRNVVEAALSGQEVALEAQGIRVVRDWEEEPYEAPVDGMRLGQVLTHLFSHATEAMPTGGELRVSLSRHSSQGKEWLAIQVSDTGRGIPPERLDRIFDPFFTPKGTGVGLGMAIAHRIVALHQGRLEVRSQMDQGTTFTVRLPLSDPED
ncbi:MAG: response regulator [Candidatus Tectomicrobia bacterium]|uniref:histidine kinase n=1 Tax=Tectimicrobiota bacterium TaxID=2528274 RepID=A0A932CNZ0_UNCTE|nr:response regulator [Candidatus Tectomicrobia bacterium]